jgi:D-inositol-3-phosphate glycosyltransferase
VLHDLGYGNRVVHVPAGPEVPMPKWELADHIPQFVDGIRAFADEKGIRYDLIHSHYWMSGLAAASLSELWAGAPILHMFHTLGEMKNRIARSDGEREGAYRIEGEKRVIQRADRLIVATEAEKAQLQWLYKADLHKMNVIPPGVDVCHFYPIPKDEARQYIGLEPNQRMVLFVGRIEPLKGVDTLIRAMSCLKFQGVGHPVYLAIIGGEPDADPDEMTAEMTRLQQLCDDLCMGQTVVFLGKRAQDTLPYYYSAADVLVMPSFYESFGMVALEAMACGTPVIASQVGGLAFLVKDGVTGFHVPEGDPSALCDKLTLLLSDHDLRGQMAGRAAEYAQGYKWEKIAAQIVGVYESLVARFETAAGASRSGGQ